MNLENDNLEGSVNSAVGSIKETAGKATGDRRLENEGALQKAKGHVQKFTGAVKNAVKKGKDLLGPRSGE